MHAKTARLKTRRPRIDNAPDETGVTIAIEDGPSSCWDPEEKSISIQAGDRDLFPLRQGQEEAPSLIRRIGSRKGRFNPRLPSRLCSKSVRRDAILRQRRLEGARSC